LRFQLGGKVVFAKRVNHPGSRMPERSFLRSALYDMESEITRQLVGDIKKAVRAV
jgi:hypothetical protein